MIDYHVHSIHSGDSTESVRDICFRAIEIGLTEIAFTEHLDFTPTDISYGAFRYEHWIPEIEKSREEFTGQLIIRTGVEVDYQPRYHSFIEDYLSGHEFDYILGSVHYINGILMEDHELYFPGKSVRDAYTPYFDAVLTAVETGLFDALAHLDLCKRYGVRYFGGFDPSQFNLELEELLKAVIRQEMAIEVNTSGLRQAPKETYPGSEVIALYSRLGGKAVTIGSDAHTQSQLGIGLSAAISQLEEVEISHVARFKGRKRILS